MVLQKKQTNSKWYRLFSNALEVADQRARPGTLSGPNDPVATICRAITVLRLEAIKQKIGCVPVNETALRGDPENFRRFFLESFELK